MGENLIGEVVETLGAEKQGGKWTIEELEFVRTHAILDSANKVKNLRRIAEKLSRPVKGVEKQVLKLREQGVFPSVISTGELAYAPYSEHADKRIEHMIRAGRTSKEIADSLGRSFRAIDSRADRLRRAGVFNEKRKKKWTDDEKQYLVNNLNFDDNGFSENASELANDLGKPVVAVYSMISRMRKQGFIKVYADRTKTPRKAKEAHQRFNDIRFAKYKKKEVESVKPTNSMCTPESVQVIQVVHTIATRGAGIEGDPVRQVDQYWSFDGSLLAERDPIGRRQDRGDS